MQACSNLQESCADLTVAQKLNGGQRRHEGAFAPSARWKLLSQILKGHMDACICDFYFS